MYKLLSIVIFLIAAVELLALLVRFYMHIRGIHIGPSIPWVYEIIQNPNQHTFISYMMDLLIGIAISFNFMLGYKLWKTRSSQLLIFSLVFVFSSVAITVIFGGFIPIYKPTIY